MDREKAKVLLPIIEAYANGETVQFYSDVRWRDLDRPPSWAEPVECYRIKPTPRTFYGIIYRSGYVNVFKSEDSRDAVWTVGEDEYVRIRNGEAKITLVEVLE